MFLKNFINKILSKKKILIIYRFGNSIGDQLCLTAVVSQLNKNYNSKIILFTSYPELFFNNPNFYKIFYFKNLFIMKIVNKIFNNLEGDYFLEYGSKIASFGNKYFMYNKGKQHLANIHASNFKVYNSNNKNNLSCEFFFSNKEIIFFEKKYKFKNKFCLVQSEAKKTFTPNKNWYPKRFDQIINDLKFIDWVQVGFDSDYKINNTTDLRSKTNLRELAYLVSRCEFVLCLEGFLNHLASCFKKKTFIITSGFVPKEIIKYENSFFIRSKITPACDPCYLLSKCPVKDYPCMNNILAEDVINVIKNNYYVL